MTTLSIGSARRYMKPVAATNQTLMNQALRDMMAQAREPLEKVPRRVVREELTRGGGRPTRRVRAKAV